MSSSYFQDRLAYLGERKEQVDSKAVTYVPMDGFPFTWQASVGTNKVIEQTSDGLIREYQMRDYIGPYGGELSRPPLTGDVIVDGELRCEVMAIADNVYLFTTERRDRIRIHTKVVAGNECVG